MHSASLVLSLAVCLFFLQAGQEAVHCRSKKRHLLFACPLIAYCDGIEAPWASFINPFPKARRLIDIAICFGRKL